MKRVIICILTVTLLIGALAVPSYAAEFENDFSIQILDFGFPDNFTSNLISFTGSRTVTWTLPITINPQYVEILFNWSGGTPSVSVSGNTGVNLNPLTVLKVSGNLYRAFGYLNSNLFTKLHLHWSSTSSGQAYAVIQSFKVIDRATVTRDIRLEGSGFYAGADVNLNEFDLSLNWGDSRPTRILFTPDGDYYDTQYVVDFFCEDWRLYDYVDIQVSIITSSVNSISANFNDQVVPFTVSQVVSDYGFLPLYYLTLRLDLRGLDRNISGNPVITVSGTADADHVNSIALMDATGYVVIEVDQLTYFFNNLFSKLKGHFDNLSTLISGFRSDVNTVVTTWSDIINKSIASIGNNIVTSVNNLELSIRSTIDRWGSDILTALTPDTSASDEVIDNAEEQSGQIDSNNEALQELPKPDLSGSGDISHIITVTDTGKYTLFFNRIMTAPILSEVMLLSLIFSLAGYVLFGKR